MTEKRLCALDDIADGKAAEFEIEIGGHPRLIFAVRKGERVHVYLNYCPHMGRPLNFAPGKFLMADADEIFCVFHYARFRIEDGYCVDGPCRTLSLGHIPTRIENGEVLVGETIDWPEAKP